MTVTPLGDIHGVNTQLHLVDAPAGRAVARKPRRARTVKSSRTPRVRWGTDWRLDAQARRVGREGVAAARAELARVNQPDSRLPKAS
ncbi:MAG: hypothetical protein WD598_02010 [Acidimicrobiia bacterium]